MDNKQKISKAIDVLTSHALMRCPSVDLQHLMDLYRAAMDAVHALPDAVPLAIGGSHDTAVGAGAGFAIATLVADETQALILAELRKHTALMEILANQGADTAQYREIKAREVASSAGRFALAPNAPLR